MRANHHMNFVWLHEDSPMGDGIAQTKDSQAAPGLAVAVVDPTVLFHCVKWKDLSRVTISAHRIECHSASSCNHELCRR